MKTVIVTHHHRRHHHHHHDHHQPQDNIGGTPEQYANNHNFFIASPKQILSIMITIFTKGTVVVIIEPFFLIKEVCSKCFGRCWTAAASAQWYHRSAPKKPAPWRPWRSWWWPQTVDTSTGPCRWRRPWWRTMWCKKWSRWVNAGDFGMLCQSMVSKYIYIYLFGYIITTSLPATSLEIMIYKGNHSQMALFQVSEIL